MTIGQLQEENQKIMITEKRRGNVRFAASGTQKGAAHFTQSVRGQEEIVEIAEDYIRKMCARRGLWKIISEGNKKMGSLKTFPETQFGKQIEQQSLEVILLKDQQNITGILLHHCIPVKENKMST